MMLRAVVEVVYSLQDVWSGLPYVCIAAGIFTGGTVLWYLFIWVLEYLFLGRERHTQWVLTQKDAQNKYFVPRPGRSCGSITHLILQTLFFSGLVFILWIASAMAGFNPWTAAAVSLGLSVFITYTFATPLGLIGTGWALNVTNGINVGDYCEFFGMPGWDGRIARIYNMHVIIERYDEATKSGEEVYMPISHFLSTPRKRNWHKERTFRPVVRDPSVFQQQAHQVSSGGLIHRPRTQARVAEELL